MATASSTTASHRQTGASVRPLPPLENGDRLTRAEFERRYEAMPDLKKAELIEGVVYMGSPVRARKRGGPHAAIITWLGSFWAATPGVLVFDNATIRLDLDNEPQPDVALLIDPARGGQARISDDDYIEGAPELVVEIASSSVSFDLHDKLRVYRRNGVREYLTWRVLDDALDWRILREGQYEPLTPDDRGRLRSEVFPGLWLDPAALLRGDLNAVLAALGAGTASPEHAAFVDRLRS
jgi:Uma2 family endonuclease